MRNLSRRGRLAESPPTGRSDSPPRRARAGRSRSARLALSASAVALAGVVGLGAAATPALAADNCANAQFRTGASAQLPDCRAYELATPADKGGAMIRLPLNGQVRPGKDAESFLANAIGLTAPESGESGMLYRYRTSTGWHGGSLYWNACGVWGLNKGTPYTTGANRGEPSFALVPQGACHDPNDQAGTDIYRRNTDGSLTWLSHDGQRGEKTADVSTTLGFLSDGQSRFVVFRTKEKLLPAFDASRLANAEGLYQADGSSTVPVAVDDGGAPISRCGEFLAGVAGATNSSPHRDAVSEDGRVVLFTATPNAAESGCKFGEAGGELFARIDAKKTVHISRSRRTTPQAPTAIVKLIDVNNGGRVVLLHSSVPLLDGESQGGFYVYDLGPVLDGSANEGVLRALQSLPATAPIGATNQVSADGSRALVTVGYAYSPGDPSGYNLYAINEQGATLISDGSVNINASGNRVAASPDLSKVVYPALDGNGAPRLYLKNLDSPSSGSLPACVSCPTDDQSAGNANAGPINGVWFSPLSHANQYFVSNEGEVVFQTDDRLDSRDSNNEGDVYIYRTDGRRDLISGGSGSWPSLLVSASVGLDTIQFVTSDSLVGVDGDGDNDVYVAKVGGGFASDQQEPPPASCAGDACQGAAPPPAPGVLPTTTWFRGLGNVPAPTAQQRDDDEDDASKPRVSKVKAVRGTSTRIRVRVPGEGRIRTSGSGLRRSYRTAKSETAKTYRVRVRLSKRAKRTLSRKGRVRVRVTVRFTPEEGKKTSTRVKVTFRKKKSKSSSRVKERSRDSASRATGKGGR